MKCAMKMNGFICFLKNFGTARMIIGLYYHQGCMKSSTQNEFSVYCRLFVIRHTKDVLNVACSVYLNIYSLPISLISKCTQRFVVPFYKIEEY